MREQNAIFWLRVSYWIGAIIDGLVAIPMLFPSLTRLAFGFDIVPDPPFRSASSPDQVRGRLFAAASEGQGLPAELAAWACQASWQLGPARQAGS